MKKTLLYTFFLLIGWQQAYAQIPDGSIAPDFTGTDLDGNSHNLYDLLDAGKSVFIDVSATWCGPCWNYHNGNAFKNLWNTYGPPGTNEAFCLFIEGDAGTNTACLYGPSGCVGGTQGNWVAGTPYPIIDDSGIASLYQITYFPTIFFVCPYDKKVYEAGQLSMAGLWAFRNAHCAPPPLTYTVEETRNARCINSSTGAINIQPSGGLGTYTYAWSNGATTQDLNNIPAGTYTVTITAGNNSIISDPIVVEQPAQPLALEVIDERLVGCNGITGSITVSGVGGWESEYNYQWSNGQVGDVATGLSAGTYRATVTDANGCTATVTHTLAPAVHPVATIAPPAVLDCGRLTVQLNGTGSDNGDDFSYTWFTSNGGNIVSGGNTLTPTVNSAGNYTLRVTNDITACASFASTAVTQNIVYPNAHAGPNGWVTCPQPYDTLSGSGSSGNQYTYNWTGPNIVAGGNTLSPVVGAPGTYTLVVTNTSNSCTSTSTTSVQGNNQAPNVAFTYGPITCSIDTITINTSINSNHASFSWSGPNGFISTLQNPSVVDSGLYHLVVLDTLTSCVRNTSTTVIENTSGPALNTNAGDITCIVNSALVFGTTPDTNATYTWTGPNGFNSTQDSFFVNVPGNYQLVLTDPDNGCTSSAVAVVDLNTTPPVASAIVPGNLNCNTFQLQLNGTGSSQGINFTYLWSTNNGNILSGDSTQTPLVDATGEYLLQVTNTATGCTNTALATVQQSQAVSASIENQVNVACFGGENGAATAVGAGGNNTFTYAWSNGTTGAVLQNVAAGTYVVSVTDGENCSASTTVTIGQPAQLSVNATATAQSMNGVNDGTASANPSGGTTPYSYLWNNNATTQTIADLAPGSYSVIVTDANGCTALQLVTVNAFNCALSGSISGTNLSCFGAQDGTATVSFIGGVEPYTYAWSNGAATSSISGISAGIYTVNVADANNCPATLNIQISEPLTLQANATATHETALGAADGSASANPTGGTGSYSYLWSTGATTQHINGLSAGAYTVQVIDENNCISTQTVVVNAFSCAISTSSLITHVSCPAGSNGTITVALTGGEAPFVYAWSNGGTGASINNLSAGVYTVSVTDANQCLVVSTATITAPTPFSAWEIQQNNPVCPDDPSGSASVAISGGTQPYTFVWSNGASGSTVSNLTVGVYSVQLTDANGCTQQTNVSIAPTDNQAPILTAQDATVALDQNGQAVVSLAQLNAIATDNCGVAQQQISPSSFSCLDLGEHIVTFSAVDISGLVASITVKVNVIDNISPNVNCPQSQRVCANNNAVTYAPATAEDNCLILNGTWNQVSGLPSGAAFPVGITQNKFEFTDASGNVGSCSFTVEVTEAASMTAVSVVNDQNGLGTGAIDATVAGAGPFQYQWTFNGQPFANTEDLGGLTAGVYQLVVTDINNCAYALPEVTVTNSVSVKEPDWLSGMRLQPNPASEETNVIFSQQLSARLEISLIDATGRLLKSMYFDQPQVLTINCTDLPAGVYTLRFRADQEIGARKLVISK